MRKYANSVGRTHENDPCESTSSPRRLIRSFGATAEYLVTSKLYYGDNLDVLRSGSIPSESVDLIYLDPPFNSKRDYNLLFRTPKGQESDAQIIAFEDTWHWGPQAEKEYSEIIHSSETGVAEMMQALRRFLGENDVMAYLTMMANRLIELRRVLKTSGSIYLHCDPTASHYLKIVMDGIFGKEHFRNEIVWKRSGSHNNAVTRFAWVTDRLLYYTKGDDYTFNQQFVDYDTEYVEAFFRHDDDDGRGRYKLDSIVNPSVRPNLMYEYKGYPHPPRGWSVGPERMALLDSQGRLHFPNNKSGRIMKKVYLNELSGMPTPDVWTDIKGLSFHSNEKLGYPTQKPLALLDRIITTSSNPGDVILDPFCGCGTAVLSAQKNDRAWIGIDITHLAISLIEKRLKDSYPGLTFEVEGTPTDIEGARDLAIRNKYQFQWWACSLVNAQPFQGKKKGADGGIDGLIFFEDEKGPSKKIIVSVKGGENVSLTMLKDLIATVHGEKAQIGIFVTLTGPTKPMIVEAARAGYYESPLGVSYPRIQILTIAGLLSKTERPLYPLGGGGISFKRAPQALRDSSRSQERLF